MFNYHDFILDGLMDGIANGQSRFVITERSARYMESGVLLDEDMMAIDEALAKRDTPAEEPMVIPEIDTLQKQNVK